MPIVNEDAWPPKPPVNLGDFVLVMNVHMTEFTAPSNNELIAGSRL